MDRTAGGLNGRLLTLGSSHRSLIFVIVLFGRAGAEDIVEEFIDVVLLYQVIFARVVVVPDRCEVLIQILLLLDSSEFADFAQDVARCDVCFVFAQNTSAVSFTEGSYILANGILDVFLVVSQVLLLLDQAQLLLLCILLSSDLLLLFPLLLPLLVLLLSLLFVDLDLFFLLSVLRAVDPLDMRLRLIILIH